MKIKLNKHIGILLAVVMAVLLLTAVAYAENQPESYILLDKRVGISDGQRLDSATPYLVN